MTTPSKLNKEGYIKIILSDMPSSGGNSKELPHSIKIASHRAKRYSPKGVRPNLATNSGFKHQSGVVLLVGLIMLMLLTMIGLSGSQVTSLEEKMAGNMKDRNLAFQAAEAALREGEANVGTVRYDCANGSGRYYTCYTGTKPVWDNIDWSASANPAKTVAYTGNLGVSSGFLSANPRYIIEYMGPADCVGSALGANDCHNYRITSRATGGTENAVVMLQSVILTKAAPPP
ncbi:Tfp pilus assembly protein PilX [Methyloglobulus morosus KoM1]|uniref:Tfp pilus assembly protein PilX n=1 Tax=Methyloglobulus morosus KoM1 TaxID=1116472 RepID=V5CB67_9GAMM|nr:PilX N-terminal domain-containing pilus assembly protein [Methyloglobulus morosus]ESS74048.1 Tfp pilus assembly protein PilX [Methyloglobulus morosus KoM1]